MKEQRKVKNPNEIINFTIEGLNFTYTTFFDKGLYFTFVHKVEEDKLISKSAPVLMQFETKEKNEYINLKKDFSNTLRKFISELKNKKNIEQQLVEIMKKELSVESKWFNPEYQYVEYKNYQKNNNNNNVNSGNISRSKKCSEIKPVILLETLEKLGKIIVSNITPNTSGEEFWNYKIVDDPEGREFKTSVKTKSHLFSSSANLYSKINEIFNDVKQQSKGYGKGSVGLVQFLGNYGLFPNPLYGQENNQERYDRSVDYILNKIYPEVESNYLANDHELSSKIGNVESMKIMNYSRMPFKNNNKINIIKDHLINKRKLSEKLITRLLNEDLLYGGSFLSNSLGKENTEIRFYTNQFFFKLTDKDGNETGAEKLAIIEKTNLSGVKEQKLDKRNTHPVKGNSFKLKAKTNNPIGTFIAEAVIDVCSAYELFTIAGIDADNINYVSIQGCNNLGNFLAINAGFSIETNEEYRPHGEAFGVKFKSELEKVSSAQIENYNNNFSAYDYYFVNTDSEKCKEIAKKMPYANKILGKEIKILNKKQREDYISYDSFDKMKSVFLDETSFDEFFMLNKITFEFDSETNKYKTFKINDKEDYIKLNQDVKNEIYSKMMKNFGSTTLMFGLDNDEAGLKYKKVIQNLGENLGIKVFEMYPDILPNRQSLNIKELKDDVNDILKNYHLLKDNGKEDAALDLVEKYIKKLVPNFTIQKKNKVTKKP